MRSGAVIGALALTFAGCRAGPEGTGEASAGYFGIEKIAILAKGME